MDIGWIFILLAAVLAGYHFSRIANPRSGQGRTVQQPQAAAPAPAPAEKGTTVIASAKKWSKYLVPVVGAIAAIGVVVFVARSFGGVTLPDLPSTNTLLFPAAVLVLLALAVLGAMGKAGAAGTWSLGIVTTLVVGFVLYRVGLYAFYGDKAERIVTIQQERNAQEALTSRSSTQRTTEPEVVTITVTSKEWSEPIRVKGGQCIRAWGDNPAGTAFTTQILGINAKDWIDFYEWHRRKQSGDIRYNPGWYQFRATGKDARVHYTILSPSTACD